MSASKQEVGIDPWVLHATPSAAASRFGLTPPDYMRSFAYADATSVALAPEAPLESLSSCRSRDLLNGARVDSVVPRFQAECTPTTFGGESTLDLCDEASFMNPHSYELYLALQTEGTALPEPLIPPAPPTLDHSHAYIGLVNALLLAGDFGRSSSEHVQTPPSSRPVQADLTNSLESSPSQTLRQPVWNAGYLDVVDLTNGGTGATPTVFEEKGGTTNPSGDRVNEVCMDSVNHKGEGGTRTASDSTRSQTCFMHSIEERTKKGSRALVISKKSSVSKLSFYQSYESVGGEVVPIKPCEGSKTRYKCPSVGCESHFSTSGHARRHSRLHLDLKPFECPHSGCGATFTRRDNCTQHLRVSHRCLLHSHQLTKRSGRQQG